jgi:hypothetical protein
MVEYTRYPWVRVYACDTCAAPVVDCQSHPVPVDGTTQRRFMTTSRQLWKHHYKYHRVTKQRFMTTPRQFWQHHYKYHRDPMVAPAPSTAPMTSTLGI